VVTAKGVGKVGGPAEHQAAVAHRAAPAEHQAAMPHKAAPAEHQAAVVEHKPEAGEHP
jgi:hypothetical protein